MTKNALLIVVFLFHSMVVLSQEEEHPDVLATDSTWGKEFFEFPIRFAQKIAFSGIEDARFPKGWGDEESSEFWSYAFGWNIDREKAISEDDMEVNLQYYFDGLLGLEGASERDEKILKTRALFIQTETLGDRVFYIGKIKTFDTRFTKKPMTLHVQVEQQYCKQIGKTMVLFKFSPKPFDMGIWQKLEEVKLRDDLCEK